MKKIIMTRIINTKNYSIAITILFIILLSTLYSQCERTKVALSNNNAIKSEIERYRLKNGQLVSSIKTLQITESELKQQLSKKEVEVVEKFSEPKSVIREITKTKIDTIKITYKDTVPCIFERNGALFHQWYSLGYKSNQKGVEITDLSIPDSIIIVTGYKRKWFLGKKTLTADITHANPFVNTEQAQHFEIKEKKRFWQTDLFKICTGIAIGKFAKF